ncbi:MAG TPA: phytanoyl-CoA dioxygenase family protein [Vicinamibacteria bacterium]|jgi:ectoine hydroxylase-related dioxygenase (phytanoyl-CoA dioxygenase family)
MSGSREARSELDERGFTRLDAVLDAARRARVARRLEELLKEEGERAGAEFRLEHGARRLANLADKGDVFLECMLEPAVLQLVGHVLGPRFKLSSLNARWADPGGEAQPLHADVGAIPDERGSWVANALFMLDDFTAENGALRAVPGSHRAGRLPADALADPRAPHAEEVLVTGAAGDVVVMNAHLWHAGTANRTPARRLALHCFYCRSDKPQQQYQKRLLRPETQAVLKPEVRALLALDDPLNDALSAEGEGASGFLRPSR